MCPNIFCFEYFVIGQQLENPFIQYSNLRKFYKSVMSTTQKLLLCLYCLRPDEHFVNYVFLIDFVFKSQ